MDYELKTTLNSQSKIFIKAYRSFLQTEGEMFINQFQRLYIRMTPALHKKAASKDIDIEAFIYAFLRLPQIMNNVNKIVLGQTDEIFHKNSFNTEFWRDLTTPARRRKMYFDDNGTLAVYVNSVTDVDDIVCLLMAFEIEWNKIHTHLEKIKINENNLSTIKRKLKIGEDNWNNLMTIWGPEKIYWLKEIKRKYLEIRIRQLQGSYVDYKRAMQRWYEDILNRTNYKNINNRPIFFVSSNNHSIVNTITGWVNTQEDALITYMKKKKMHTYLDYWKKINSGQHQGSRENFLWYILKKYEKENPEIKDKRISYEQELGIDYIEANRYLDINTQIIGIRGLIRSGLAEKLHLNIERLAASDAIILNIDYPLGFGAYIVLSTILRNANNIRGVYILGKASFLHGNIGDIGLPNTVYDSITENLYFFNNSFTGSYFSEYKAGNVMTNQKVVSTKGTLLDPDSVIEDYFKQGYTIIEMENGSYLNAIYETTNYKEHPHNEIVNLVNCPIDIGIIHYASDTPYTKAITLGTRSLGYEGVEATYTSSLAILKRITELT